MIRSRTCNNPTETLGAVIKKINSGSPACVVPHLYSLFVNDRVNRLPRGVVEAILADEYLHVVLCSGELGFKLLYYNDASNALFITVLKNDLPPNQIIKISDLICWYTSEYFKLYSELEPLHHKILAYLMRKFSKDDWYLEKILKTLKHEPTLQEIAEILLKFDYTKLKNVDLPDVLESPYPKTDLFQEIIRCNLQRLFWLELPEPVNKIYCFRMPFMISVVRKNVIEIREVKTETFKISDKKFLYNFILSIIKEQFVSEIKHRYRNLNNIGCLKRYGVRLKFRSTDLCKCCQNCMFYEFIVKPTRNLLLKLRGGCLEQSGKAEEQSKGVFPD